MFEMTIEQAAKIAGGEIKGRPQGSLTGVRNIESAQAGDITFLSSSKYERYLSQTKASCIIVYKGIKLPPPDGCAFIYSDNPYDGFIKIIKYLDSKLPKPNSFIHPTAVIDESADVHPTAYISAGCYVGAGAEIGEKVILKPGVKIYDNCKIGNDTLIHANSVIYQESQIGNNCRIQAGAVIGSDGFGNIEKPDGSYEPIPQIGNVKIGDNVDIGANTTIDRALVGSTVIKDGVKLDNLVHIAHNCVVGEDTAMAAQVGVSGSVLIGKRNRYAGQVGIAGHIDIADDVTILAKSGVPKTIDKKGTYFGIPVRDKLTTFKIYAAMNNLPDILRNIKKIENRLAELEKQINSEG